MAFGIDDLAVAAETVESVAKATESVSEKLALQEFSPEAFNGEIFDNAYEFPNSDVFVECSTDIHSAIQHEFSPDKFADFDRMESCDQGESETLFEVSETENSEISEADGSSEVRQIKTINSGLEGQAHPVTGVEFERKVVVNEAGESVEGVFPQFESVFDAQLPEGMELSTDADQFNECNRQLKERFDCDPDFRERFDERQKENIEDGQTPYGYTWHHSEEIGKMELVDYDTHQKTAHTGGRSIWGGGGDFR